MMRNWISALSAAAFAALLLAASPAAAQTLTRTQDMAFGAFAAGAGGTVTISPQSARTATGDVTLLSSSQGNSAAFDVSGSAGATYQITLPADGTVSLTGSNGGSMAVSSFTSSPSGQGQLSLLGAGTLYVGATIGVGSNQTPGAYSGSFNVTVTFQ